MCILFHPKVHRGQQGTFIVRHFTKYKHFHESARVHESSQWHIEALQQSKLFLDVVINKKTPSVSEQLDKAAKSEAQLNRKKITSIVSRIVFCEVHDLPLIGKTDDTAVFNDLRFRMKSGDNLLQEHLHSDPKNASYTSHQIQNEILEKCCLVLRDILISEVKSSVSFSVLTDETADIRGTEQLSIGIRYVTKSADKAYCIRDEFFGYVPIDDRSALSSYGFDLNRLVGQGYDGCSATAG